MHPQISQPLGANGRRRRKPGTFGWLALAGLAGTLALGTLPGAALAQEPALQIKFGDFFAQPIGPRGLEISPRLREAQGQIVQMRGWMVAQEQASAGYFLLTPRPVRMSEHADGDADDLPPTTVVVRLPAEQAERRLPHQAGLIELSGRLSVGRAVEPDGRVSWVQLSLDPDLSTP